MGMTCACRVDLAIRQEQRSPRLELAGLAGGRSTAEAVRAKDAAKLECLLQAREYQRQGHQDVQPWIDSMVSAVRTKTGKAFAKATLEADPVLSGGVRWPLPTGACSPDCQRPAEADAPAAPDR